MRIDKSYISAGSITRNEQQIVDEMRNSTPQERFALITYLRESFYGPEASTGRLQRVFKIAKLQ